MWSLSLASSATGLMGVRAEEGSDKDRPAHSHFLLPKKTAFLPVTGMQGSVPFCGRFWSPLSMAVQCVAPSYAIGEGREPRGRRPPTWGCLVQQRSLTTEQGASLGFPVLVGPLGMSRNL